jgi:hypothetical protein
VSSRDSVLSHVYFSSHRSSRRARKFRINEDEPNRRLIEDILRIHWAFSAAAILSL